jgi:hypothetical protein
MKLLLMKIFLGVMLIDEIVIVGLIALGLI